MAETKGYHVTWEIDIDSAESPRDAAEQAWDHMRRNDSTANVFDVIEHDGTDIVRVDLMDEPDPGKCVDCGTQCVADGSLAVLCPNCDDPLESCPKCGTPVRRSAAFEDEGTGSETGGTFYYCSEHCRETH